MKERVRPSSKHTQASLNLYSLLFSLLTIRLSRFVDKRIYARGDGALIGQVSRDAAFVLCGGAPDEGTVVNETVSVVEEGVRG